MFEEIKKNCPKAWEKWIICFNNGLLDLETECPPGSWQFDYPEEYESLSGWLFKFFDKQKVIIQISYSSSWYYRITDIDNKFTTGNLDTPHNRNCFGDSSRQQAEQVAFTKAFEILEGKDG